MAMMIAAHALSAGAVLVRVLRDTRFARDDRKFRAAWSLVGDSLVRPPRGYAADHPAIEDLKRKDLIGLAPLSRQETLGPGLVELAAKQFAAAAVFMAYLCEAVGVQY